MKPERVNFLTPKLPESFNPSSVEYIIYAQVFDTLLNVCKNDFEGTIKYLKEGDPKVQDVAALKFHQNHQLEDLSKKIKIWSGILFKHTIVQEELPLLFQLLIFQFAIQFYNLDEKSINFKFDDTNILTSRFKQLENMCQRLVNDL